jgi:transcriptional regulator with XRE-family HTH domain
MEHTRKDLGLVVGDNLKRLIKKSGYKTQEEFASRFGTDVRTVNRWVNQGLYNLITIEQVAHFFDVDPLTLLS